MRAQTPSSSSSSGITGSPAKAVRRAVPATCSEAQRRGAVILEVLAGVRSASQGAAALGISVNHYYLLERQALHGLAAACGVPAGTYWWGHWRRRLACRRLPPPVLAS